jgi:hypothetical protein
VFGSDPDICTEQGTSIADRIRTSCLTLLFVLQTAVSAPSTAGVLEEVAIPRAGEPLIVPVTVEGQTYSFVVDTGTSQSVFDASLCRLLGKKIYLPSAPGLRQTAP